MPDVWDAMKKREKELAREAKEPDRAENQTPEAEGGNWESKKIASSSVASATEVNYAEVLIAHHDRAAAITEEYRALRTSLLAGFHTGHLCQLVTSSVVEEGKTVTCLNLALIMTELLGKGTIIVDCDLQKGKIADLLGAPLEPGMADLLRGTKSLHECIQPTCYQNLFFLPAGKAKRSEIGELVARPELELVLAELRREYDHVLLDGPPVNQVSDATLIGSAAGSALLVVRMEKTPREYVDRAIRLLHGANVEIAGIVLTHCKYERQSYRYRYA